MNVLIKIYVRGGVLRALIYKQRNMTGVQFANRIGITPATLSRLLHGRVAVSKPTERLIMRSFSGMKDNQNKRVGWDTIFKIEETTTSEV